jgi:WD40 repeat protein
LLASFCGVLSLYAGSGPISSLNKQAKIDRYGDPLPAGASARMGTIRFQQEDSVKCVAFSPDGKTFVIGHYNFGKQAPLRLCETATGKEIRRFADSGFQHVAVAFTPDGQTLIAAMSGNVYLWDVSSGKKLRDVGPNNGHVYHMTLSSDGKTLATGGMLYGPTNEHVVRLWDLKSGKELHTLRGHKTPINSLAFITGTKTLASTSSDHTYADNKGGTYTVRGTICVWDAATGKQLQQRDNPHRYAVFSPDGKTLASDSADNKIHVTDLLTGKERYTLPGGNLSALFSPDSKLLVTEGGNAPLTLWNAVTGKEVRRFEGSAAQRSVPQAFSPDGKRMLTFANIWAGASGTALRLWDVTTGKEVRPYGGHSDAVQCLAFAPGGKVLASGSSDYTVRLWESATGKELSCLKGHQGEVRVVAFAPDGKTLVSAARDQTLRLWQSKGKEVRQFPGAQGEIVAAKFSADGKTLVTGSLDGTVQFWDVATGKEKRRYKHREGSVSFLSFSSDLRLFVSFGGDQRFGTGDGKVRVWKTESGKELLTLDLGAAKDDFSSVLCWAAAFSPDGRLLATSESRETFGLRRVLSDHKVRVWELATGQEVLTLPALKIGPSRLVFSPDGRTLASLYGESYKWGSRSSETTVVLWDLLAGTQLRPLPATEGQNTAISVRGDPLAGPELGQLKGHLGQITDLTFAPDGKTLATGSVDHTVLVWNTQRPEEKPVAVDLKPKKLEDLWSDLALEASKGYGAIAQLTSSPKQTLAFLKKRLQPVPPVDAKAINQLIETLANDKYAVRQKAFVELEKAGDLAELHLRKALEKPNSLEVRKRLELLLDKVENLARSPKHLRTLRVITVLERIGSAGARQLLQTLAKGAPEARLTQEAQTALDRLGKRVQ